MKKVDLWLKGFRRIWETRFEQLNQLLNILKKSQK
jgi:hypothetical protein